MASIVSHGVYVPAHRLAREELALAYGRPGGTGQRSVAGPDEDSLTMAAEALRNCLDGAAGVVPDRVLFASTTPPYLEKSAASLLVAALDLPRETVTADYGGSLRASVAALRAACDAVDAGSATAVAVVAADARTAAPGSDLEPRLGAGAGAVLIAAGPGKASLSGWYEYSENLYEAWRPSGWPYVATGDNALARSVVDTVVASVLQGVLEASGLEPDDIDRVAAPTQTGRQPKNALRRAGLEAKAKEDSLAALGYTGCAAPLMALAGWLETAAAGDAMLTVAYGDGAAGFVARCQAETTPARGVAHYLARPPVQERYVQYLQGIGVIDSTPGEMYTSAAMLEREEEQLLRLHALRCGRCGAIQYPFRKICWQCGATGDFHRVALSRQGTVLTFTREHLFPSVEQPTVMAVVSLDGGGRFFGQLCDCDPSEVNIGTRVELVLRVIHRSRGIGHYFWKARPEDARVGASI